MVMSQFYQAVKRFQEAGGKQNEKKTQAISHSPLVCTGVAFPSSQLCVYIFFIPPLWKQTHLCWDPKVLTSLSLCLIIYWRKSTVCSAFYTLFAVCLWEWKMRQGHTDEILDPLKARGVCHWLVWGHTFALSLLFLSCTMPGSCQSWCLVGSLDWHDQISVSPNLNSWHLHGV